MSERERVLKGVGRMGRDSKRLLGRMGRDSKRLWA